IPLVRKRRRITRSRGVLTPKWCFLRASPSFSTRWRMRTRPVKSPVGRGIGTVNGHPACPPERAAPILRRVSMFVPNENTPREYSWGADAAISELLGKAATGAPEAELWLGSPPGSPARVIDPAQVGGAQNLAEWIAAAPSESLGTHPRLPFLFKVLAAGAPLSLQAHPTPAQAKEGFARENELGVPLGAPHRNYKDPYPKPEIILAVSERFE